MMIKSGITSLEDLRARGQKYSEMKIQTFQEDGFKKYLEFDVEYQRLINLVYLRKVQQSQMKSNKALDGNTKSKVELKSKNGTETIQNDRRTLLGEFKEHRFKEVVKTSTQQK